MVKRDGVHVERKAVKGWRLAGWSVAGPFVVPVRAGDRERVLRGMEWDQIVEAIDKLCGGLTTADGVWQGYGLSRRGLYGFSRLVDSGLLVEGARLEGKR